jgi:hypothetical protein
MAGVGPGVGGRGDAAGEGGEEGRGEGAHGDGGGAGGEGRDCGVREGESCGRGRREVWVRVGRVGDDFGCGERGGK